MVPQASHESKMKAVVLKELGSPQGLRLLDIPDPVLGPDDVLVRVRACGVCHHDVAVMKGLLRRGIKNRVILGHEIAGEVVATGAAATVFANGDRVASVLTESCGRCDQCLSGREHRCLNGRGIGHSIDGGYAEFVRLHERALRPIPQGVTFEQAAVCACPIGVALHGIRDVAVLRPSETALVTGAGGGLGVHSVQIARLLGARVIATTGSPDKVERLKGLGAADVILSPDLDFHWEAKTLTQNTGADVVVDTVGSAAFKASFASLAPYGRLLMLGEIAGSEIVINPAELLFKDARLLGSAGAGRRDLDEALHLVQRGLISPVVTSFSLDDAPKVHQLLLDRALFGRAILVP